MPLVIVHHANQFLIADGYPDREGIDVIASGYAAILRLHERHAIPASLHLSGTLVEALAWHRPDVLELVRRLNREGLIDLVGGAYAPAILTAFDDDYVRRQLDELLAVYARQLDIAIDDVRTAWVPERVWDTRRLAPLLADPTLPNGGYRSVLLDDRLLFSAGPAYEESERERFDAGGPYAMPPAAARLDGSENLAHRAYLIAGGHGLVVVPISAPLRYAIPPRVSRDYDVLMRSAAMLEREPTSLVTYADDLERVAGVGGWDVTAREAYAEFLSWLAQSAVPVAHLGNAIAGRPAAERRVEPGTYYELAREWSAGEDYRGWLDSDAWRPYREMLSRSLERVREAERRGAAANLIALAWKHLLASGYETAWHDGTSSADRAVAGWARAIASHSRAALVIADAALWLASDRTPRADLCDIDEDGEYELVLANDDLYAVILPGQGARISYLFAGDKLVIGNPTDDWNLQEALGRSLVEPPNHPGAFADVGGHHDRYVVEDNGTGRSTSYARLRNVQSESRLWDLRKTFAVRDGALAVCYDRPSGSPTVESDIALSPDYLTLLRQGTRAMRAAPTPSGWEVRCGDALVRAYGDGVVWVSSPDPAAHASVVRVGIRGDHDHLLIVCGPPGVLREESSGLMADAMVHGAGEREHDLQRGR